MLHCDLGAWSLRKFVRSWTVYYNVYVLIAIAPYIRHFQSVQMLLVKMQDLTREDTEDFYWKYDLAQRC